MRKSIVPTLQDLSCPQTGGRGPCLGSVSRPALLRLHMHTDVPGNLVNVLIPIQEVWREGGSLHFRHTPEYVGAAGSDYVSCTRLRDPALAFFRLYPSTQAEESWWSQRAVPMWMPCPHLLGCTLGAGTLRVLLKEIQVLTEDVHGPFFSIRLPRADGAAQMLTLGPEC